MTLQEWFEAHPLSNCKSYDMALWQAAQEAMREKSAQFIFSALDGTVTAEMLARQIRKLPIE
jgi:hypothetical protein